MTTIHLMLEITVDDDVELPPPYAAADELREAIDDHDAWPDWVYTVDGQDAMEPAAPGSMLTFRKLLGDKWQKS